MDRNTHDPSRFLYRLGRGETLGRAPDTLCEAWQKRGFLKEGDHVVVGISGGSDSVFLLHCLAKAAKQKRPKLTAAHFNHQTRNKESDRDEAFTVAFCKKMNIPVRVGRWERVSEKGEAPVVSEEAARKARYDFFEAVCREIGANKIALAHTRDDDAETVLFRLLRGSGLSGLRGIPSERPLGPYRIIRPLKELSRKEIQAYLRKKGIAWCEDSSNQDPRYTRNRIRHFLLPFLEKEFNANIREILAHLSKNVSEDYDYLQKESESAFGKVLLAEKSREIVLKRRLFQNLPLALQKQIFREIVRKLGSEMDRIGYSEWERVSDFFEKKTFRAALPGPLEIKATPTKIVFRREI